MATITSSMFMAVDGVVDPMIGNWHFPYFNEEMGEAVSGTHDADVFLFIAAVQFPIYLIPTLLQPVYRRLLRP